MLTKWKDGGTHKNVVTSSLVHTDNLICIRRTNIQHSNIRMGRMVWKMTSSGREPA